MSKGSARRPPKVDQETIRSNWDKIFGNLLERHKTTLECPQCKSIELRPTENGMWGCDHCFIEIQF